MSRSGGASHRIPVGASAVPTVRTYLAQLQDCLRGLQADQVAECAERLWEAARANRQIFVAGNGGSAATASHMALDLGKGSLGRPPRQGALRVRTVALNDPGPVMTAWANDHGYERVFAEQIVTLARPGDVAVFFSVSGNSPNIVAAARAARSIGATVIGLLGRPGGAVRGLADLAIVVPSEDFGIVEDVHLAINHMVTRHLRKAIASTPLAGTQSRSAASPAASRSARSFPARIRRGRSPRTRGA